VAFAFAADLVLPQGGYDVWLTLDTSLLGAKGSVIMRAGFVSRKDKLHIP
jgi:hypothetical protein